MSLLYKLALLAYPASFRKRYAGEMARVYVEARDDARAAGPMAEVRFLGRSGFDLARGVLRERATALELDLRFAAFAAAVLPIPFLLPLFFGPKAVAAARGIESGHIWIVVLAGICVGFGFALLAWRARRFRNRLVLGGLCVAGGFFVYLSVDDPKIDRPVFLEDISPAFPGAEESFAVLMRYGRMQPAARAFKVPAKGPAGQDEIARALLVLPMGSHRIAGTIDREKLGARRAVIQAAWAELVPVRAWVDELSRYERIGDLTPARKDAEIIQFRTIQSCTIWTVAVATLQAMDGDGDAALATLTPLLDVSQKLKANPRTLSRFMMANVTEKYLLDAATDILEIAPVSAAGRARFGALLARGVGGEAHARYAMGIEYAFYCTYLNQSAGGLVADLSSRFTKLERPLNIVSPLIYNPHATVNASGHLFAESQDLAARRDLKGLDKVAKDFSDRTSRGGPKNALGRYLLLDPIPALSHVAKAYWDVEDKRAALAARLKR